LYEIAKWQAKYNIKIVARNNNDVITRSVDSTSTSNNSDSLGIHSRYSESFRAERNRIAYSTFADIQCR